MEKQIGINSHIVWADIPETNGRYRVSTDGQVYSVANNRLVKPSDNGKGYKYFSCAIGGKRTHIYIHRAVANAFLKKPFHNAVVNHIDFDKNNNSVENLEWCTQKDNVRHSACNMVGKSKPRNTNTGEAFISFRHRGKCTYYRINAHGKEKLCKDLQTAIKERNRMHGIDYDFKANKGNAVCVECENPNVEFHHCFSGTARRSISDKYGFVIPVCRKHHAEIHMNPNNGIDLKWKRRAQKYFETFLGSRDLFIKEFGKNYLED